MRQKEEEEMQAVLKNPKPIYIYITKDRREDVWRNLFPQCIIPPHKDCWQRHWGPKVADVKNFHRIIWLSLLMDIVCRTILLGAKG